MHASSSFTTVLPFLMSPLPPHFPISKPVAHICFPLSAIDNSIPLRIMLDNPDASSPKSTRHTIAAHFLFLLTPLSHFPFAFFTFSSQLHALPSSRCSNQQYYPDGWASGLHDTAVHVWSRSICCNKECVDVPLLCWFCFLIVFNWYVLTSLKCRLNCIWAFALADALNFHINHCLNSQVCCNVWWVTANKPIVHCVVELLGEHNYHWKRANICHLTIEALWLTKHSWWNRNDNDAWRLLENEYTILHRVFQTQYCVIVILQHMCFFMAHVPCRHYSNGVTFTWQWVVQCVYVCVYGVVSCFRDASPIDHYLRFNHHYWL